MSSKLFEDGVVEGCTLPVPPCLATISLHSQQPPRIFTHSRMRCSGYSI